MAIHSSTYLSPLRTSLLALSAALWAFPANAQSLIADGTFDGEEIVGFWGNAPAGFEQTLEIVAGEMCSTVMTEVDPEADPPEVAEPWDVTDKNPWDVAIGLSEVPLVAGQHYHMSFTAHSTTDGPIRFKTGLGEAPWSDYYLQEVNLTATAQTFEATVLNLRDDDMAQFQFQVGRIGGTVCFDNIVLEPVDPPAVPEYVTPAMTGHAFKDYSDIIKIGVAVDTPIYLSNPLHNSIVEGEFAGITPANSMKMNNIHGVRGTFNFVETDALLDWAGAAGLEFRGHPLVWHTQASSWVEEIMTDETITDKAAAMRTALFEHVDGVMAQYPDLPLWDVLNEAIEYSTRDGGTEESWGFRDTLYYQAFGAEGYQQFIDDLFTHVKTKAPNAKTLYNDYNASFMDEKGTYIFEMIKGMKARDVPIDAVGLQNHWYIRPDSLDSNFKLDQLVQNMARYAELGVDVHITELDIRITDTLAAEKAELQAKIYGDILKACLDAPNCTHLTVWGLSDLDSWVPSTFDGEGSAHLWDMSLMPKAAYHKMIEVLSAYPANPAVDTTGDTTTGDTTGDTTTGDTSTTGTTGDTTTGTTTDMTTGVTTTGLSEGGEKSGCSVQSANLGNGSRWSWAALALLGAYVARRRARQA